MVCHSTGGRGFDSDTVLIFVFAIQIFDMVWVFVLMYCMCLWISNTEKNSISGRWKILLLFIYFGFYGPHEDPSYIICQLSAMHKLHLYYILYSIAVPINCVPLNIYFLNILFFFLSFFYLVLKIAYKKNDSFRVYALQ